MNLYALSVNAFRESISNKDNSPESTVKVFCSELLPNKNTAENQFTHEYTKETGRYLR